MDAILDDVKSTLRRTLLTKAERFLQTGERQAAAHCLRQLGTLLRSQAEGLTDSIQRQRQLEAAVGFEAQADALTQSSASIQPGKHVAHAEVPDGQKSFASSVVPDLTLDDVVGMQSVKDEIRRCAVTPFLHRELARRYRVTNGGGVLLFGPPGTGKTYLARAIAGSIDAALFVVKGSDLLSKWQGESESNLARLFNSAREHPRSLIFVDEFQWLAARQDGEEVSETGRRMVCQLLQELEGFEQYPDKSVLFLAATNYPWMLDEAVIRLGRFQKHILVPPPDKSARVELFRVSLEGRPTERVNLPRLAEISEYYTAGDIVTIVNAAALAAVDNSAASGRDEPITQADLEAEIGRTKPSASAELVRRCAEWAQKHQT